MNTKYLRVISRVIAVIAAAALGVVLSGCTSKRDRLTTDTLDISIDPAAAITLPRSGQTQLKVIARSAKTDAPDIEPTWAMDSAIGTFSPAVGKSTVFTAGNFSGVANITALYGDKVSRPVKVVVGTYYVYDDAFAQDLSAPGTFKRAGDSIVLRANTLEKSKGTQSFEALYSIIATGWAGWYVSAVTTKDMSAYANGHLTFFIKSAHDIEIKIKSANIGGVNNAKVNISEYIVPDGNRFQKVSIPLSVFVARGGIQLNQMQDMFIASAVGAITGAQTDQTYTIDDIYWTED